MKIIIESNAKIMGVFEPPIELDIETEDITIREVLRSLSGRCRSIEFLKKDGSLGNDVQDMRVNKKNVFALERGLQSSLKDGDRIEVELSLQMLGGG